MRTFYAIRSPFSRANCYNITMWAFLLRAQKIVFYSLGGLLVLLGGLGLLDKLPLFETNLFHNIIFVITGLFLASGAKQSLAAMNFWARYLGMFYAVLAILGSTLPDGEILGYLFVNLADNLLHALYAIVLLFYGFRPPEHSPRTDHDLELQEEQRKEEEVLEAERAKEPIVRGNPIVDLRSLAKKEPDAPPRP